MGKIANDAIHAYMSEPTTMQKLLSIVSDSHKKSLRIVFPPRVVSAHVDELCGEMTLHFASVEGRANTRWTHLEMDFTKTEFVDSLGINLIFDLVRFAEDRKASVVALLVNRAVRSTFYTVRLDKKMDIRLVEVHPQYS